MQATEAMAATTPKPSVGDRKTMSKPIMVLDVKSPMPLTV